jgi:hypothetical protein
LQLLDDEVEGRAVDKDRIVEMCGVVQTTGVTIEKSEFARLVQKSKTLELDLPGQT